MATSKTGSFWLTESFSLTAVDTLVQSSIDLGSYTDIGSQTGLAIEQVDFIVQSYDTANENYGSSLGGLSTGDWDIGIQLADQNPASKVLPADANSLVASGLICYDDSNNVTTQGPDVFPDTFGKLDQARIVIGDQLFTTGVMSITGPAANREAYCTVRIKARLVKLSQRDWMSLAVTSIAAD